MKKHLILILLFSIAGFVQAQSDELIEQWKQIDGITIEGFYQKFVDFYAEKSIAPQKALDESTKEGVTGEVRQKNTGAESFAGKLSSTINDYTPFFNALFGDGLLGDPQGSEDGKTLTLQLNPIQVSSRDSIRIELIFREPDIYIPLANQFDEAVKEARTTALKSKLDSSDDLSIKASWNMQNKYFGRKYHKDNLEYMVNLIPHLLREGHDEGIFGNIMDYLDELKFEGNSVPGENVDKSESLLSSLNNESKTDLSKKFKALAEARLKQIEKLERFFKPFPNLISNQPQFNASYEYRNPDALAGPRQHSFSLGYEYGFVNFNKLRRDLGEKPTLAAVERFFTDNKIGLNQGNRLSFSLEYNKVDDYSIMLPEDLEKEFAALDLNLAGDDSYSLKLAWGRSLSQLVEEDRIDLSFEYEKFKDELVKKNRGVLAVTYTKKITDSLVAPLVLTYANYHEYLGDVDHEFSAHLGISYKSNLKNTK